MKGRGGSALVDLVAIVKHVLRPEEPLVPVADQVEARYQGEWLEEKANTGGQDLHGRFSGGGWMRSRTTSRLACAIEREDFEDVPFNRWGGLGVPCARRSART